MESESRGRLYPYSPSRPPRRRFGSVVLERSGTGKSSYLSSLGQSLTPIQIFTISQDGALFRWSYTHRSDVDGDVDAREDDEDSLRWRIAQRHYFLQNNAKIKCAAYHAKTNLLVTGFSNGLFGLYELPDFNMIHNLRCSSTVWFSWKGKTNDMNQHISKRYRLCDIEQFRGMAGVWRFKTWSASCLGVAIRVIHPEAARSLRLHECSGLFPRWPTYHYNRG